MAQNLQSGNIFPNPSQDTADVTATIAAAFAADMAINTVAASGAAQTLSFNYAFHDITLTANCVFTLSDAPIYGSVIHVRVTQGGVGGFTKAFPATVEWPDGGAEPAMNPNATGDVSEYIVTWDGTHYVGSVRGDDIS